jgi:hypothetical protein
MGGMISVHIWGGGVAQGRWLHGSSQADTSCAVLHSGERWTISHPEALENRSVTLAASPEALGEMSLRTPRSGRATQAHHVGGEGATHTHTRTEREQEAWSQGGHVGPAIATEQAHHLRGGRGVAATVGMCSETGTNSATAPLEPLRSKLQLPRGIEPPE